MKRNRLTEFYKKNRYFFHVNLYIFQYITLPGLEKKLWDISYKLAEYRDPSPRMKKNEDTLDYYKRIDYKYSLRNSKYFYKISRYQANQIKYRIRLGALDKFSKKDRKLWEDLADSLEYGAKATQEAYETILVRKRVEEEMNSVS